MAFGGDLNAHMGANGDTIPTDNAGRMLLESAELMDMIVVNTMGGVCSGGPTRVQVRADGTQSSTVDYVLCSSELLPAIRSLEIDEDQMGSDHRPLFLTLTGIKPIAPQTGALREVWNTQNIPSTPHDWSWVHACSRRMKEWCDSAGGVIGAAAANNLDSQCVSDVLEWSFQCALDGVAAQQIGTRTVGPRAVPTMSAAMKMAVHHKQVCEDIMKTAMGGMGSDADQAHARSQFLSASRGVRRTATRCKQVRELALFRQVEEVQRDSKLFWGKFKPLRNSIAVRKSPPPSGHGCGREHVHGPLCGASCLAQF